jgi:Leucine Rich repeats (2 copies)
MAGLRARQRIVVPFDGHVIGEGFNSETVTRVQTGLNVARVGEDPVATGQTASFKFQMLTSQGSLEKALNASAELEARYGLFSGGAKFSFAEENAVNFSSTYILASCAVTNALQFGSGFQPNETADRLIRAGDEKGFKTAFGDRYTQALHTGGEFHALVRVTSSSVEHQRQIAASLHAELNGLFTSGSFKGSLESAQKDTSSHTEVDVQVHQTGGVGDQIQIPGTDADRIRDHMNHFAAAAHAHGAAFAAELLTYDTLALPFPPFEELEDRRVVLEDALAQRQLYASAISDLKFAQTEDAPLIFEDLPPREELVKRENDFRRVLNDLMTHARQVASGAIPPTVFVPTKDLPLPRFKRRTAGSFGSFWARARNNDPGLLQDERTLIERIAAQVGAAKLVTVPLDQATPEAMERAADQIEELDLTSEQTPLRSLASLPKMIDAPLRKIRAEKTRLDDFTGLEGFSRLEFLLHDDGRLRDIGALASIAGLRDLRVRGNQIADLSPLAALTNLEILCLEGNKIETLDPLRGLHTLSTVVVAGEESGNPIVDARALAELPRLSNPFTSAGRLTLKLFDDQGVLQETGLATRIKNQNRFQFTSDKHGDGEQVQVTGLREWIDLDVFPAPVVMIVVHFATRGMGMACTQPDDRSKSLPADQLISVFQDSGENDFAFQAQLMLEISPVTGLPGVIVELEPA